MIERSAGPAELADAIDVCRDHLGDLVAGLLVPAAAAEAAGFTAHLEAAGGDVAGTCRAAAGACLDSLAAAGAEPPDETAVAGWEALGHLGGRAGLDPEAFAGFMQVVTRRLSQHLARLTPLSGWAPATAESIRDRLEVVRLVAVVSYQRGYSRQRDRLHRQNQERIRSLLEVVRAAASAGSLERLVRRTLPVLSRATAMPHAALWLRGQGGEPELAGVFCSDSEVRELLARGATFHEHLERAFRHPGGFAVAIPQADREEPLHVAGAGLWTPAGVVGAILLMRRGSAAPAAEVVSFLCDAGEQLAPIVETVAESDSNSGTDPLTGLSNRRQLESYLRERELSSRRPLAVALVDLDDLKVLNDRLGHTAGDAALRVVAATLRAAARETDHVARIGGDEFVVVLDDPGAQTGADFEARCRELLPAVAREVGITFPVGFSFGWSSGDGGWRQLFEIADGNLYERKRSRRGTPDPA